MSLRKMQLLKFEEEENDPPDDVDADDNNHVFFEEDDEDDSLCSGCNENLLSTSSNHADIHFVPTFFKNGISHVRMVGGGQ